jgi:hypothetical protein
VSPWFALAVLGKNRDEASRDDTDAFWEQALSDNSERIWDADFFHGFGEGAADLWEKVQDKL